MPADPVTVTAGSSAEFTINFHATHAFFAQVSVQCAGPSGTTCQTESLPIFAPGATKFKIDTIASRSARPGALRLGVFLRREEAAMGRTMAPEYRECSPWG